jgi:putative transposase
MHYRRIVIEGACYFFTLTLENRKSNLLTRKIIELRASFRIAMECYPFVINGIVILPDHMHIMMTLPPHDSNYSQRLGFIKSNFSRQIKMFEPISHSKTVKRERGIWQRRFWEHTIRDAKDYDRHLDYIHYNPVKHGLVQKPSEWEYSSIHRYIKMGVLSKNWGHDERLFKHSCGE